ncbi:MAG: chlorophyll synthesis pathway protein BchC [Devosia sp.]
MEALAIVLNAPRTLSVEAVKLCDPSATDVVVDVEHTGISAGTERLLWDGKMPPFPGMGYPLVPGYETVGRVVDAGSTGSFRAGDAVFVPGARCYEDVRPLFGGAASRLVCDPARIHKVDNAEPEAVLLALAATAHHAIAVGGAPDLIVGHGVLGRLVARIAIALGNAAPTVHEINLSRSEAEPYPVVHPDEDERRDYRAIMDASGDHKIIDKAVTRLGHGGSVTLAGFYGAEMTFAFPAAFMKEVKILIAAEWAPPDLAAVQSLLDAGTLSLTGLITHTASVQSAPDAYRTAFTDPDCLKMVLNWGSVH